MVSLLAASIFLILLWQAPTGISLKYGEGLQFSRVLWYHFPKTGGTSMRSVLHNFCQAKGFNLTSDYGEHGCEVIPFSCHSGTNVYFTYGHVRDDFITYASRRHIILQKRSHERTLYVLMIREPLSWLMSRHQHLIRMIRKNGNDAQKLPSLFDTAVQFGTKYFNFLPDDLRDASVVWFERAVAVAVKKKSMGSDHVTIPLNSSLRFSSTPSGIAVSLERSILPRRRGRGAREPSQVLVLITEYYVDSLKLLDYVFSTSLFTFSNNSRVGAHLNRAQPWQDSNLYTVSPGEIKIVSNLLEVHQAVYQICLKSFLRAVSNLEYIEN